MKVNIHQNEVLHQLEIRTWGDREPGCPNVNELDSTISIRAFADGLEVGLKTTRKYDSGDRTHHNFITIPKDALGLLSEEIEKVGKFNLEVSA